MRPENEVPGGAPPLCIPDILDVLRIPEVQNILDRLDVRDVREVRNVPYNADASNIRVIQNIRDAGHILEFADVPDIPDVQDSWCPGSLEMGWGGLLYSEFGNKVFQSFKIFLRSRKKTFLVQQMIFGSKCFFTIQIQPESQKTFWFRKAFFVQKCFSH